ncbi:MAG: globin domain-containing protein [Actinomycetota bacterium]
MDGSATLYERVGGTPFFERLVGRFYDRVETDDVLLATYPQPDDLRDARRKLTLFLVQYWGGPPTYHEERGHPALRMRHAPFAIDDDVAGRWLTHMRAAVAEVDPPEPYRTELLEYFAMAAPALRNR